MGQATITRRRRPPTHPGGILKRHYLRPLGIGIVQAAEALGVSRQSLSKIVHERRAIWPSENDAVIGGKAGLYWTIKQ